MDIVSGLFFGVFLLLIGIGFFLTIRNIVLWYFRVNEAMNHLALISYRLEELLKK